MAHELSRSKAFDAIKLAQAIFFLNAAIWLAIGIASLIRIGSRHPNQAVMLWIIAILMLGNVGAMLVSGAGLGTRRKRWTYFALAVLIVNVILTVTDQFGLLDLITLVIDLALLGLLIAARPGYSRPPNRPS